MQPLLITRHTRLNPALHHAGSAIKGTGPLTEDRIESFRPKRSIIDVLQRDGHLLARSVDRDLAEKLQSIAWRQILALLLARGFHIYKLRSESLVERVWTESTRMNRAADELPERFKILECSLVWIIVVRGCVMNVCRDPNRITNSRALDEGKQVGDFELAPTGRPVIALRDGLDAPLSCAVIDHHQADRHVRRNHFPGGTRIDEFTFEPGKLRGTKEIGRRTVGFLFAFCVWPSIGAHVEHEHVEQGSIRYLSVDPPRLRERFTHGHIFVESPARASGEDQRALFDIFFGDQLGAGHLLAGPPIVVDFMVIPLRKHWDLRGKGTDVLVEQIVLVGPAELSERFGHLRLVFGDDILPEFAVRHFLLSGYGTVGIDIVAVVNEEIWPVFQHRRVGTHAAARLVDPPPLTGRVA